LFHYLFTGQIRETVSSIHENSTRKIHGQGPASIKIGDKDGHMIDCIDIPGHYNFRERIQEVIETAAGMILVVDSKDTKKFNESAEILYDILNNIDVLDRKMPILVACNK